MYISKKFTQRNTFCNFLKAWSVQIPRLDDSARIRKIQIYRKSQDISELIFDFLQSSSKGCEAFIMRLSKRLSSSSWLRLEFDRTLLNLVC